MHPLRYSCARSFSDRFTSAELLWGLAETMQARMAEVEIEIEFKRKEVTDLSAAEESMSSARAVVRLLTDLMGSADETASVGAVAEWLTENAAVAHEKGNELRASLSGQDGSGTEVSDAIERSGRAIGALRLISDLRRRESELELTTLRVQRLEVTKPVLLCQHRPQLRALNERDAFLRKCLEFAKGLPQRQSKLVRRVEAEMTIIIHATTRPELAGGALVARGFDDDVGYALTRELLQWWHADPKMVTLQISEVNEIKDAAAGTIRYLLSVQVLPTVVARSRGRDAARVAVAAQAAQQPAAAGTTETTEASTAPTRAQGDAEVPPVVEVGKSTSDTGVAAEAAASVPNDVDSKESMEDGLEAVAEIVKLITSDIGQVWHHCFAVTSATTNHSCRACDQPTCRPPHSTRTHC